MTSADFEKLSHRCDERCVCPECGADLYYWPKGDQHACSKESCAWLEDTPEEMMRKILQERYGTREDPVQLLGSILDDETAPMPKWCEDTIAAMLRPAYRSAVILPPRRWG